MVDNKSLSGKNRIGYLDILRCMGIILMVLGHVGVNALPNKWIHAFHMPLFFIVSGFFFKVRPVGENLLRKARTLLVPYLVIGIFHVVVQSIRKGFDIEFLRIFLFENTADPGVPIAGALWYLTAAFTADIVFNAIITRRISEVMKNAIIAAVAVSGMACAVFLPFRLPYAIDAGMVGVGFFRIGWIIKEKRQSFDKIPFVFSVLGLLVFSALALINGSVNMRTGQYAIWLLFWLNAVGITLSLWGISKSVYYWLNNGGRFRRLINWMCGVGKYSIVYLCFNQICILGTNQIAKLFCDVDRLNVPLLVMRQLSVLAVVMVELRLIQEIVFRTKLKAVFGK